ncbi:NAD(+) diphosphatase [Arthrobacter sp. H5]|uniref:NAD(+) diphosphatase n=1 Tax=Arthrobacter sp. H5 TaxID=1267973 RepID=UPI000483D972|nr:NAD(+) diphosphatase [Arthrobacter sp. H5]
MTNALRISSLPPLGSLPLARGSVDRGSSFRAAPGLFDRLWGAADARVMFLATGKSPVTGNRLMLVDSADVPRPADPIYLGRTEEADEHTPLGTHVILVILPEIDTARADDGSWMGLRDAAASLPAQDAGLFVQAVAIANWHTNHTHCPRCGHATAPEEGGWVRRCPADQSLHYPRTDPAIIATVTDEEDRVLLGSSAAWPEGRYSTLAGFVEPGESLEAAVIREIAEESGVTVHSPEYLGSQPWPFPASLMLGFTAKAAHITPVPDGVEIKDVRWFSRKELYEALSRGDISVASGSSIARSLIEHWYGGPLDEAPSEGGP